MLYDLHELQRAFLAPLTAFTETGSLLFSNPYSPLAYTPLSRQFAAAYELAHRLGKDYEKPAWNLPTTQIQGREVAVHEDTVLAQPFCRLVHFRRETRRRAHLSQTPDRHTCTPDECAWMKENHL